MQKVYSKNLKFPIIIIATCNDSEIPIDAERTFLEKINMNNTVEEDKREKLLCWFISSRGLKHEADLSKISRLCSDFVFADLEALVLHAIKYHLKLSELSEKNDGLILTNDDFVKACGKYY